MPDTDVVRHEVSGVKSESERRRRFDALFEAYSPDIVAYCGWRAPTGSDPQDAVADVFLTAWRRLDEVPEGDAARVWLYATARRVIANQRRSSRRQIALHERLQFEAASAAQLLDSMTAEETLVQEALQRLSEDDREILLLAEWEDLSAAEIAAVLRCRMVTARGRLHRPRRRFRTVFYGPRSQRGLARSRQSREHRPRQRDDSCRAARSGA